MKSVSVDRFQPEAVGGLFRKRTFMHGLRLGAGEVGKPAGYAKGNRIGAASKRAASIV